jgi:hypothetical protein
MCKPMTLTLNLQPEIERGLLAQAQAKGVSLTDFAEEVLARASAETPARAPADRPEEAKNLYELFAPVRGLLTDEEIDLYFSRSPSASRPVSFE